MAQPLQRHRDSPVCPLRSGHLFPMYFHVATVGYNRKHTAYVWHNIKVEIMSETDPNTLRVNSFIYNLYVILYVI